MQVNYPIKLKHAGDRLRLDRFLKQLIGHRDDLGAEIIDSPDIGGLGLPGWTSVIVYADHGRYPALETAVHYELDRSGLADRFEEWPS